MKLSRRGLAVLVSALFVTSASAPAAGPVPNAGPETVALPDSLAELARRIEILAEEIDRLKTGGDAVLPALTPMGLSPGAGRVYEMQKAGASIAGYGEALYENFSTSRDDGAAAATKDRVDFLRAVVYFGYRYNDWILFNSEIEFEHGSTGKGGEVSVEFAYIDLAFAPWLSVRSGMLLVPLGIVNEKHEPTTFPGTIRPAVERLILPSTWRTIGAGILGEAMPGLSYRLYAVEGLSAAGFSGAEGIRGGRQSGARALAEQFALAARLEYSPFLGTLIGGGLYAGNSGQGARDSLGDINARTIVATVHGEMSWRGLELRALYAVTDVGDAARISRLRGQTVGSRMNGWYVSAGYDILPHLIPSTTHALAPYVVYERYNTHASVPGGFTADPALDRTTLTAGIAYMPDPRVAFKWDHRDNRNAAGTATNQWNLAINYLF